MADKLIYIPNEDTQNHPVCRLQLVEGLRNKQPNTTSLPVKPFYVSGKDVCAKMW